MADIIKITSLTPMGTSIPGSTLVPAVEMAGTPTTKKATIANIANAILSQAGNGYVYAARANLANTAGSADSVSNASQPNITSVGTLTSLTVSGETNLGPIGNVIILGGTDGQFLSTDGEGTLSWTTGSGGNPFNQELNTTDNVQFANITSTDAIRFVNSGNVVGALGYAPTFVSVEGYGSNSINITTNDTHTWSFDANGVLSKSDANGLVLAANYSAQIIADFGDNNRTWLFDGTSGELVLPGGNVLIDPTDNNFEVRGAENINFEANTVVNIYTDTSNNGYQWQFGDDGNLTLPGNTFAVNYANGTQVNISGGGASLGNLEVTGTTIGLVEGASESSILVGNGPAGLTMSLDGNGPAYLNLYANTYDSQSFTESSDYTTGTYTTGVGGGVITLTGATVIETFLNSLSMPATITSIVINGTDTVPYDGASYGGGTVNINTTTAPTIDPTTVTSILFNITYQNQFLIDEDNNDYGIYLGDLNFNIQTIRDVNITAGDDFRVESTDILSFTNNGIYGDSSISFTTDGLGNSFTWAFDGTGATYFPTLTVELHNGGTQSAQTLQFGDNAQQAVITGPTPALDVDAQRLIIQGQRGSGTGEGGDVYFWAGDADTSGGDIKIYAGDADNVSAGYGGYVNIEGGSGFDAGGHVDIQGGQTSNGIGAYVSITGGYGGTIGGDANISGGFGALTSGGNVNIIGGTSGQGLGSYGNVYITSGSSSLAFTNDGTLTVPGNLVGSGASPAPHINGFSSITTTDGGNIAGFVFGDGNLTLPGNTFTVNYANGTQVPIATSSISNGTSNVTVGNSGNVTVSVGGVANVIIATSAGAVVAGALTATGKIGYSSGASVTQVTNRGQGVSLDALCGDITLVAATMAAGEVNYFTINNNSYVSPSDMVIAEVLNNFGSYIVGAYPSPIVSGSIAVWIRALDAVGSPETPIIRIMILKAANA